MNVELQTRQCACGCDRKFRTIPTSSQLYASSRCAEMHGHKAKAPVLVEGEAPQLRNVKPFQFERFKEPPPIPLPRTTQKQRRAKERAMGNLPEPKRIRNDTVRPRLAGDFEKEWDRLVAEAKERLSVVNKVRMEIADLAIQACDIRWGGGGHWSGYKNQGRTLKAFALEIGMAPKTLSEWVRIKRDIVSKLPKGLYDPRNHSAACRTLGKTTKKTPAEEVIQIYKNELERKGSAYDLHQAIKQLTTVHNKICARQEVDFSLCDKKEIQMALNIVKDIQAELSFAALGIHKGDKRARQQNENKSGASVGV